MAVTIKKGSKGEWVRALQYVLGVKADGKFGSKTKKALKDFQRINGLTSDGIAGKNTWNKIKTKAPTLRVGASGTYVYVLECLLSTLTDDGHFEQDELQHVKTYQSAKGLSVDGVVGPKTWGALFQVEEVKTTTKPTTSSKPATGTGTKKPVDYKQYDSRWAKVVYTRNNTYNKNQTIKSSGCGPTACADIIATFFDSSVTPVPLAAFSVKHGYRTPNSGTDWDFFEAVAKEYKASKFLQTSSYNTAKAAMDSGALVVVSVRKSRWTNGGHFICWWKTESGNVYINDPASASSYRAKAPTSTLKAAAKQYFCIWK